MKTTIIITQDCQQACLLQLPFHSHRLVFCLHQPLIIQEIVLRLLTTKLEIAMPNFAKIPQHPFSICNNIL